MQKVLIIPAGVLVTAGLALGGDHWRCRARPVRNFCHLPCYDYRGKTPGNPDQQTTFAAIPLTFNQEIVEGGVVVSDEPGIARTKKMAVKVFQLSTSEIRVKHCRLTQVAITVVEDGTWTINCIAEQNPALVDDQERPPLFNFKRNRFFVDFRGVGVSEPNDPPNTRVVGQPQLFQITPEAFWVEAGQKRVMRWTGQSPDADRFFELVNRVDVDLRFE
jgi:hypothetical protein